MTAAASVLRIRINLAGPPVHCEWVLLVEGSKPAAGSGPLTALPPHVGQVEVIVPAAQVLLTRCVLPASARRHGAALLAYAAEESLASEPDANSVFWLATADNGEAVLAVLDKHALQQWRTALGAAGIGIYALSCEALRLPWHPGGWSLGWNGSEGYVRSALAEACATDTGDHAAPPLALLLLLDAARDAGNCPATLTVHATGTGVRPDAGAWSRALGVEVVHGALWQWYQQSTTAGPVLVKQQQHWQRLSGMLPRLRPALGLCMLALVVHAGLLVFAWTSLAAEQGQLRGQMEARFRQVFPEAVAVVDPVLQMRRQLAEARGKAGLADPGDFLPLLARVATAAALPPGSLRVLSYERERVTLEVTDTALPELLERLRQAGLAAAAQATADGATVVLTAGPA